MLGLRALKRYVVDGDGLAYLTAKLSPSMFKGDQERSVFEFVQSHFSEFRELPKLATLESKFPELAAVEAPESSKYYASKLDRRFAYDAIDVATTEARKVLKEAPDKTKEAEDVLRLALGTIAVQRHRNRVMDVGVEVPELLLSTYHGTIGTKMSPMYFGWPYMDALGGVLPGELVSFVGRPAAGKTYQMLYVAMHNWRECKDSVLFVSMEMGHLAIAQRVGSMYSHLPVGQLKVGGFSSKTFKKFVESLHVMSSEQAKFYVVDGNLAVSVEDVYSLAEVLGVRKVLVDGAYLMRHPDRRLGRYDRVAENTEWMRRLTAETGMCTAASWQFSREAVKKKSKNKDAKAALEDIGYSDVIGQVSAIVIGIMQEESVETILRKRLDLLKGRNGEVGAFDVRWDFQLMDFRELTQSEAKVDELDYV
jgi:replicative DNA helicase